MCGLLQMLICHIAGLDVKFVDSTLSATREFKKIRFAIYKRTKIVLILNNGSDQNFIPCYTGFKLRQETISNFSFWGPCVDKDMYGRYYIISAVIPSLWRCF